MSEKYYDEVIAPKLAELADLCHADGMAFIAVVEYEKGQLGRTIYHQPSPSIEMVAIEYAINVMPNVDSFIIGMKKYCNQNKIDYSGSIYMNGGMWPSAPVPSNTPISRQPPFPQSPSQPSIDGDGP